MQENKLFSKTFLYMALGLLITFITGIFTSTNEAILNFIYMENGYGFILVAVVELVLVIVLSAGATKMSSSMAKLWFVIYSIVSGLTFAGIFLVYEINSIIEVFLMASILFGAFAFLGYTTDTDLTNTGKLLTIALIVTLIVSIINIFIGISIVETIIDVVVVIIMVGFTAYDTQKLKEIARYTEADNVAIIMALSLYLDFLNILLRLLTLFGKEKD